MTWANLESIPFNDVTFLIGVFLLLLGTLLGVTDLFLNGDSFVGTDNCLFTEGGVRQGLIKAFRLHGKRDAERPMLLGNVWLLFITEPFDFFPSKESFLPEAYKKNLFFAYLKPIKWMILFANYI